VARACTKPGPFCFLNGILRRAAGGFAPEGLTTLIAYETLLKSVSMRMVGGRSSFWARLIKTDSNSRMVSRSKSLGAVAASMAAAGSSTRRQAFAGDWLIHRANWSPQCLSACSSCSDSLIGGKCAKEHLSNDFGCLDPGNCVARTEKFTALSQELVRLTKPNVSLQRLRQSLQGFQNTGGKWGFV
jgi:hypothetical protein